MVVKTSGWGVADMETRRLWDLYGGEEVTAMGADAAWDEEGERAEELEGELDGDGEEGDMATLRAEMAAIEEELRELRRRYRRTLPALNARSCATRHEVGRRLAALIREGEDLGWTLSHLAGEYHERYSENAA